MHKLARTGLLILVTLALYAGTLYIATRSNDQLHQMKDTMQSKVGQVTYNALNAIN